MKLIEEIGFDVSFSFVYSARPGTPAAELPDTTEEDTKKQRLQILQTRINQHAQQISRRMVGEVHRVLIEGPSRLSLIHISEPTRPRLVSRLPSSA